MNSKQRRPFPSAAAGFTLIEIMVVIVILGLLATLVVPSVIGAGDEARITKAQTDCKSIAQAVSFYRAKKGKMPDSLQSLTEPDDKGTKYLEELPKDPWGNDYVMREGERKGDIEVISWGPDGSDGTEDDISSKSKKDQ